MQYYYFLFSSCTGKAAGISWFVNNLRFMTQFRKEENSRIFMNFLIDYAANLKLMVRLKLLKIYDESIFLFEFILPKRF